MKKFLILHSFLLVFSLIPSISKGEETDLHSEFLAACELETLCTYTNFAEQSMDGSETIWENGKLTLEDKNGMIREVPITNVTVECECLDAKIIKQLMQLKHLHSLSIQLDAVQPSEFHVQELKSLEKFELIVDSEERVIIPKDWAKSIGASQTVRTLQIPAQSQLIQEVTKMLQLQSLTLDDSDEANVLSLLLPMKNSLRELVIVSKSEPQACNVLGKFTQLQVLSLECRDLEKQNMDSFLEEIRHVPLRCLCLSYGQIGAKGEKILRKWDSLQEVILPESFPDERLKSLEKIQLPILLSQKDGSKKVEMRRKFFRDSQRREMYRPYRLDAQGHYIHWSELRGGIWL